MKAITMKALRERIGLKKIDVASRLGVAEGTVRGWEVGRGTPNFLLIRPLMKLYGVTFDQLEESVKESLRKAGRLTDTDVSSEEPNENSSSSGEEQEND